MPPPSSKRAASADSGNHYPKRVKISPGREAFDTALDKFLGLLDGVDMAYDFIPADHAQKTLKASPIAQIPFLKFALATSKGDPLLVMFCLREADLSFPLFRELKLHPEFQSQFPGDSFSDQGEVFRKLVNESCGEVLKIGEELFPPASLPTPSQFGQRRGWHEMQANSATAILCHRPAARSPALPVKVKHPAFLEFFDKMTTTPTVSDLRPFRFAAMELEESLSCAVEQEATRGNDIARIFKDLFPASDGYEWTGENNFKKGKIDFLCTKTSVDGSCSHMMIEVKLEPGLCGDGQMQLCRMYDVYVEKNPGLRMSGVPMFLLSISGMSAT
jgi:hypothetical protein